MTHKEYRNRVTELCDAVDAYIDDRQQMDTMMYSPKWNDPSWLHAMANAASRVSSLESQIRVFTAEITSAPMKLRH